MSSSVTGSIFGVLFWVAVLAFVVYAVVRGQQQQQQDRKDGVLQRFFVSGSPILRLTSTELLEGTGDSATHHPLTGLVARVEEGGTVNRRMTATRMLTLGVFAAAAPKKLDDREVYLTIEGPQTFILRQIQVKKSPKIGQRAREFAGQLNQLAKVLPEKPVARPAAKHAAAEVRPVELAPAPPPVAPVTALAEQIRQLAALRDEGVLTEEEFQTKKAELLARM